MSLVRWPDNLPLPLLKTHSMKSKSGFLSTKLDSGHSRVRRRFKSPPSEMASSFQFSCEEYALFEGFLEYQVNGGADYFLMPVRFPIGLILSEVRIVPGSISEKLLSNHLWKVSVKFDVKRREIIDAGTTEFLIQEGAESLSDSVKILKQVYK